MTVIYHIAIIKKGILLSVELNQISNKLVHTDT